MDDGGWTVFARRTSPSSTTFEGYWTEYKNGFGDLNGEHWLGFENMYNLMTGQIR